MTTPPHFLFAIPDGIKVTDLGGLLQDAHKLREEKPRNLTRSYLDSFDWRLYQAGGVLEQEVLGRGSRLLWQDIKSGQVIYSLQVESMPRFSWDFPRGKFRDAVEPILEMRALLPIVQIKSMTRTIRILDDEDKTVLRLLVEENSYQSPDGGSKGRLGGQVRLVPVRGYDEYTREMVAFLGDTIGLEESVENPFFAALENIGRVPEDYSSKLKYKLDPDMRADAAAKEIHLDLLDTLEANIAGTKADLDSEFLHDLRVALRRTRSALTQIKGVFAEADVARFKDRLAWLQQVTGPTRDMDVYLLEFDGYHNSLPTKVQSDLDPLRDFLWSHQKTEHRTMVRKLNSPHFRRLLKEWRAFLEQPVSDDASAVNASRPLKEVADERIYKVYKRLIKEGTAIGPESPATDLHELRKTCKKLRYLMEFFQSLYPKGSVQHLIKALKRLLDNLGSFQDLEVQANSITHFGEQMLDEGTAGVKTLLAMGILVGDLLKHQEQARAEFAERFTAFAAEENRREFKMLFAPLKQGRKAA